ncbi:helix-turn-helix domain-containing protein (plasmid) [Bradyrhizobium sp. PMVTL-01]|uniref:helix-turn-helix domain-containing protein n=1 Tax=Bradyrhizobium sp. PMVTL-01 TaxID=3434999 RepID=UPI003F6F6572
MLVKADRRIPVEGHLARLGGERMSCSSFNYRKGRQIFGEGEEAKYVYQIISGAVRTYKLLPDGRRQINAFHLPGDLFGFETGDHHRFTSEALVATEVRVATRQTLLELAVSEGRVSSLLALVTLNLRHAENHMLLLGRKNSHERVAEFLLEIDEREAHPNVMTLPMSRRDIADYLGLTVETISRSLSMFRDEQLVRFEDNTQRRLVLLDRRGLAALEASA